MFWYPYISDLNCLLLLDSSPLKYAPALELPPRQRAISPNAMFPSVDRLPMDLLLNIQRRHQESDDPSSRQQQLMMVGLSKTTTTTTTTNMVATSTRTTSSSSSSSQATNTDAVAKVTTSSKGDSKAPTKKKKKLPARGKKLASREKAVSVAGDTADHRSREAIGLRAVMDELQRSLNRYKKPGSVREFIEALRNHPSVQWGPIVRDAKSKNRKIPCGGVDHIIVILHNNTLYLDSKQYGPRAPCGSRPPDTAMGTLRFLNSMLTRIELPDTMFLLSTDPRGTTYNDVPILASAKARGFTQPGVLIPNSAFGRNHLKRWDRIARQYEEAAHFHHWDDRIPQVLWRGPLATRVGVASTFGVSSTTDGPGPTDETPTTTDPLDEKDDRLCEDEANVARLEAVALTKKLPELFDLRVVDGDKDVSRVYSRNCRPKTTNEIARFLIAGKTPDPAVPTLFNAKWTGRIASMANKYIATLPDAAGAPPASRNEIWLLGSAVLVWRSPAVVWYTPALTDGVTHLTIDGTNAVDIVQDLIADDDRAQRLAFEAGVVFDNHLCASCIAEYWADLINRYNRRFGLKEADIPTIMRDLHLRRRLTPLHF